MFFGAYYLLRKKIMLSQQGCNLERKQILQVFLININDMRLIGIKLTGRVICNLLVIDFKVMIGLFMVEVIGIIIRIIIMIYFTIIAILLLLYFWSLSVRTHTYEELNLNLAEPKFG